MQVGNIPQRVLPPEDAQPRMTHDREGTRSDPRPECAVRENNRSDQRPKRLLKLRNNVFFSFFPFFPFFHSLSHTAIHCCVSASSHERQTLTTQLESGGRQSSVPPHLARNIAPANDPILRGDEEEERKQLETREKTQIDVCVPQIILSGTSAGHRNCRDSCNRRSGFCLLPGPCAPSSTISVFVSVPVSRQIRMLLAPRPV